METTRNESDSGFTLAYFIYIAISLRHNIYIITEYLYFLFCT